MKTQKVRILVAVAKDGSYMAGGSGEKGKITDPGEHRGWVCDGIPEHVNEGDYHYVVVEAEVPLPVDLPLVEGKVRS